VKRINIPIKSYPLSSFIRKKKISTLHVSNNNVVLLLSKRRRRTYVAVKIIPYEWDIPYLSREELLSNFEWGKPFWQVHEYRNNTYKITRVLTEIIR